MDWNFYHIILFFVCVCVKQGIYTYEILNLQETCASDYRAVLDLGVGNQSAALLHMDASVGSVHDEKGRRSCTVTIKPPENHGLSLVLEDMYLRKRKNCIDYVQILTDDFSGRIPDKICGYSTASAASEFNGYFSSEISLYVFIDDASSASQTNVSFTALTTAFRAAFRCNADMEFPCHLSHTPDPQPPTRIPCIWRGLVCDGHSNCVTRDFDESPSLCATAASPVDNHVTCSHVPPDTAEEEASPSSGMNGTLVMIGLIILVLLILTSCQIGYQHKLQQHARRNAQLFSMVLISSVSRGGQLETNPGPPPPSYSELEQPPTYESLSFEDTEKSAAFKSSNTASTPTVP